MSEELPSRWSELVSALCAITLGVAMTLALRGYQFGHSNHTVYLIDALRHNQPELLANDWFATHTLQYHVVFTRVTAALDRAGVLRPAFLLGYLALAVLLHVAWLRWVRALGGSCRVYLLSVVLYLLSAGGFGLGMYEFLQDSAFLPSNVANVAMLWGLYLWVRGRAGWAGLMLGVAGFFHLNHALVGIGVWGAVVVWDRKTVRNADPTRMVIGTILLLALALPNIVPAARAALAPRQKIPLREFVDLYVHLRHPHHYDPASWPVALWVTFLWPFPLAWVAWRRAVCTPALRQTVRVTLLFFGVLLVAILFAGVWYVSEPLVQMSLFRFSIFLKVLTCVGAAVVIGQWKRAALSYVAALVLLVVAVAHVMKASLPLSQVNLMALTLFGGFTALCGSYEMFERRPSRVRDVMRVVLMVIAVVGVAGARRNDFGGLGVARSVTDPPDYLAVCDYARGHTPVDAVFLVPPNEEEFRLVARRAVAVNFKGVPQLSSELGEWRDRLCQVLDLPDLRSLPHRMDRTLAAIGARYAELSAEQLVRAAETYRARYVVTTHPVVFAAPARLVFEKGNYHLYDLNP